MSTVKLIGKPQDGTTFVKKGFDDEVPFEFKTDQGKTYLIFLYICLVFISLT